MPAVFTTWLRFEKHTSMANNTALATNERFTPVAAYDVDPRLGSTSVPGFNEFAALYRDYRVLQWKSAVQFANKEAFAVTCFIHEVAFADPGVNAGSAACQSYLSNRLSRRVTLSAALAGTPTGRVAKTTRVEDVGGMAYVGITDPFCANVGGTPVNSIFEIVGAVSTDGATPLTALGIAFTYTTDIQILFYTLHNPTA